MGTRTKANLRKSTRLGFTSQRLSHLPSFFFSSSYRPGKRSRASLFIQATVVVPTCAPPYLYYATRRARTTASTATFVAQYSLGRTGVHQGATVRAASGQPISRGLQYTLGHWPSLGRSSDLHGQTGSPLKTEMSRKGFNRLRPMQKGPITSATCTDFNLLHRGRKTRFDYIPTRSK